MSLSDMNVTEEIDVMDAVFEFAASSAIPLLLMESFMLGALCCIIPFGTYMLWIKLNALSRISLLLTLCIILVASVTHWALALRQLESLLAGGAMKISLTIGTLFPSRSLDKLGAGVYVDFQYLWRFLRPLVTETVLLGFSSSLFVIMAYTSIRQFCSKRRSHLALILPIIATITYTVSVAHWITYVRYFAVGTHAAEMSSSSSTPYTVALFFALMSLMVINTIMSDSIVLWRMCVVWGMARPALAFAGLVLLALLGVNIVNIIWITGGTRFAIPVNPADMEIIWTYGQSSLGQAAAFMSLASNVCATGLVALKAWLHRRRWASFDHTGNRRTLATRVMLLLVESGFVYTSIWVLYCVSFYKHITMSTFLPGTDHITAIDYLDSAMAQITSIYPLLVFIILDVNKIQYAQGNQIISSPTGLRARFGALSGAVVVEQGHERCDNTMSQGITLPMVALNGGNDSVQVAKDTKPRIL